jgi:ketosteroid isomerase-like protein
MNLEQLTALEDIKQLKARYCLYIDYHEWDNYADLFTEDATLDTDSGVSVLGGDPKPIPQLKGRVAIRKFIDELLNHASTVHQVHSPIIELDSLVSAKAIWAMEDVVEMPGFHIQGRGHYRETYRKEPDGKWRIASLHLTRTRVDMLNGDATGPVSMAA